MLFSLPVRSYHFDVTISSIPLSGSTEGSLPHADAFLRTADSRNTHSCVLLETDDLNVIRKETNLNQLIFKPQIRLTQTALTRVLLEEICSLRTASTLVRLAQIPFVKLAVMSNIMFSGVLGLSSTSIRKGINLKQHL